MRDTCVVYCRIVHYFMNIIPRLYHKKFEEARRNRIHWTGIDTSHTKGTFRMKSDMLFLFGYIASRTIADAEATEITGI